MRTRLGAAAAFLLALTGAPALADGPFPADSGFKSFGFSLPEAFEYRAWAYVEQQNPSGGSRVSFGQAQWDLRYVFRGDSFSFGIGANIYAYYDTFWSNLTDPEPYAFAEFGPHRLTFGTTSQAAPMIRRRLVGELGLADNLDSEARSDVVRYDYDGNRLFTSASYRKDDLFMAGLSYVFGQGRAYGSFELDPDATSDWAGEAGVELKLGDLWRVGLHGNYSSFLDGGAVLLGADWVPTDRITVSGIVGRGHDGAFSRVAWGINYRAYDGVNIYAGRDHIENFGFDETVSRLGLTLEF